MTSPARQREADRVEEVYYYSLNQIANQTVLASLVLWQEVPASQQARTSVSWLANVLALVSLKRELAIALVVAYYRLVRALRTGNTMHDPFREGEEPDSPLSLDDLRQQFVDIVDEVDAETSQPDSAPVAEEVEEDSPLPSSTPDDPEPEYDDEDPESDLEYEQDDQILAQEIADLEQLIAEEDAAAEEEAANVLDQLGTENLLSQLEELELAEDDDVAEVDDDRRAAHESAGQRAAAAAARISMNAARGLLYSIGSDDPEVIAWARYSKTGSPCGYCAALISRGAIYRSSKAAQSRGKNQTENKYHDNCRCVAVPVFSQEQFDNSPLFAFNRELGDLARSRTAKGKSLTLPAWRRLMRDRQKATPAVA